MVFELINFSFTYESEEVSCKLELGNYMLSVSEGITVMIKDMLKLLQRYFV